MSGILTKIQSPIHYNHPQKDMIMKSYVSIQDYKVRGSFSELLNGSIRT